MASKLSALRKEIAKLRLLVYKDPLTGVYNRRGFIEEVQKILATVERGRAHGRSKNKFILAALSVVMLDIDSFKKLNDAYGHDAGDAALKAVAQTLIDGTRQSDFVGRWGGEEFVVTLLGAGEKDGALVAENLRRDIEHRKITFKRKKISLSASFGIAEFRPRDDLGKLIDRADKAMYAAKKGGKNQVVKFSDIP